MRTISLSDLQTNFTLIDKSLKTNEYILLTNKGNAIGLLSSLSEELFNQGFVQWIGIKSYQTGDLTLRQLAGLLKINTDETIKILNNLNIPIIDYNFDEDLETLKKL